MSTDKKTITINPDLFQLNNGGKTKKSTQNKNSENKIKMRPTHTQLSQAKNNTLKRKILKVIRAKQQDEYKRLFSNPTKQSQNEKNVEQPNIVEDKFNKDFDKSLQYLSDLEKKVENENPVKTNINATLRNYPQIIIPTDPAVLTELPPEFNLGMPTDTSYENIYVEPKPYVAPQHPGYGCLKNGSMPTYRTIKNRQVYEIPRQAMIYPPSTSYPPVEIATNNITESVSNDSMILLKPKTEMIKMELRDKMHETPHYNKIKNMKRRKIYKRTYRVGKSKTAPKIGCLISNKTIRKKIQQTAYDLKHTNMKDVRKFLLKRGFIKIGTTAPNDVLRKMYESVAMVCGEVYNHNPDNLLFNFVNDKENL